MNRLCFEAVAAAENFDALRIGDGKKIIRAGHADRAAQRGMIHAGALQIARVGCEHRGDISARGMSGDEDALWIAADIRQQCTEGDERLGAVFDERWKAELRIE